MSPVLVIGGTRGLGASIVKQYAADAGNTVYGTTRSEEGPEGFPNAVKWLPGIDLMDENVGKTLVSVLGGSKPLSTVVCGSLLCTRPATAGERVE